MPAQVTVVFVDDEQTQELLFSLHRRDEADCTNRERRVSTEVLVLLHALLSRPALYEECKKLAVAYGRTGQGQGE